MKTVSNGWFKKLTSSFLLSIAATGLMMQPAQAAKLEKEGGQSMAGNRGLS